MTHHNQPSEIEWECDNCSAVFVLYPNGPGQFTGWCPECDHWHDINYDEHLQSIEDERQMDARRDARYE